MDMESTRRSFDRSREPGAKKPRLINELDRGSNLGARPFPQRQAPTAVTTTLASASVRFRTNNDRDSESSDPGRGGYYPQPPPHQELVTQYKTALAELTFNSKPIITNLTIIAGENLSAAKAIAGTVCSNILEVPSEQKLPSLYLLDSIVKNIGRDYIKYFAVRLPEVFCKAYRHVDPPVHSSMRHLFGTWKGVFPPQTLQIIEKELGFNPAAANGLASATLRSDSQSQRPPHSIHVNPKYLERQRLQQSGRTKEVANDMTGAILNSNENPERPDKTSGASRPWLDPRINMHINQRIHRDPFNESILEKSTAVAYGGIEYSSDISSKLGSGIGRTGSRVMDLGHEKTLYKEGSGVAEIISGQSNGFSLKHGFSDQEASKPMNLDAPFHPKLNNVTNEKSSLVSGNWKNSEEEEYMWNDMNSGSTGHGVPDVSNNLSTDPWTADDENLEGEDHLQIMHPFRTKADREISAVRKQPPAFGGHPSLSWKLQEQRSVEKLNLKSGHSEGFVSTHGGLPANKNSKAVRMGNRSFMPNATTGMAEIMGQQQVDDSVGVESPSEQSPPRQQSPSPSLTVRQLNPIQKLAEKDHVQALKTPQFRGGLQSQYTRDPSHALPPNVQVGRRSLEKDSQGPLSSAKSIQPRHPQQQLRPSQAEVTVKTKKFPQSKVSLASDTSEQSIKSSLSAAAVMSGNVSKKSIMTSIATTSPDTRNLSSDLGVRPTQSNGLSPSALISSGSAVASPSSFSLPNDDSSSLPKVPQAKAGQTPRVSIKPPASSNVGSASAPTSSAADNNSSDPIANLLSSLVAKGLISAESESPTKIPTEMLVQLEDQSESNTACSSLQAALVSAAVPVPSTRDGVVDNAKTSLASCQPTHTEIRNLIGFDFKPDVIRELHPAVIQDLLDDQPHCCEACGIRLKQQEQFNKHLEWHATREREQNSLIEASRKWYAKSNAWIAGKAEYPSECTESDDDVNDNKSDTDLLEPRVLADEDQCLCVLCGELFEDVYCQERDEWMFKAAVYMNNSDSNIEMESRNVGPIIHAECLSEYSTSSVAMTEQD